MKCSFSSQILTNAAKNIRPSHIIATIRNGKFSIGFEDFFKADSFFSEADEKNSKANNNFTQKENIHNKKWPESRSVHLRSSLTQRYEKFLISANTTFASNGDITRFQ